MEETGVFVRFLGQFRYLKNINTKSGKPFCVGQISAFQRGVGYVNLPMKAFDDAAIEIMEIGEKTFVEGEGSLALDSRDKSSKTMEVTVQSVERSDYKPPTKNSKPSNNEQKQNTQETESEDNNDFLDGIDLDDMPF